MDRDELQRAQDLETIVRDLPLLTEISRRQGVLRAVGRAILISMVAILAVAYAYGWIYIVGASSVVRIHSCDPCEPSSSLEPPFGV